MLREEYLAMKAKELEDAKQIAANIEADPRPAVKYKESRPITDIKHMIETSVELYGDNVAFYEKMKKGQPYESITYKEMLEMVNGLGTALIELGLKDKKIAIIGANTHKWAISYLATVCGTGIVVPLDKELPATTLEDLVEQSGVSAVIYDKKYENIFAEIRKNKNNNLDILINMQGEEDNDISLSWNNLLEKGKNLVNEGDKRFIDAQIMRDKMSILLFTSGTTGVSKGVMLSHGNIAEDLMAAPTILKVYPTDIFFSVLPVHHTYECTCGFLMPLYKGAAIAYCEGLKYITKNLAEIKPTMFLGVPAIFELLYKKIWQNVRKQGKEKLLKRVIKINNKTKKIGINLGNIFFKDILAVFGGRMRMMICGGAAIEKLLKRVIKINNKTKKIGINLGNIFFKDILAVFGGRMRMMICGGAAINPEVLDGIRDFGINAVQGYGLTECAPLAALNPDIAPNSSSIGIEFPGIEVKIDDKDEEGIGEICVKGPNIMLGYYNMPELTDETLVNGWFRTGDMGYKDKDGYIFITGRKKNVIITKNGENVYPEEVEYLLNLSPIVLESMVFEEPSENKDDNRIAASIVIDMESVEEFHGKDLSDEEIEKLVEEVVDKYNEENPIYKRIRRISIRKEPLKKNTSNKIIRFAEENK